MSISDCAHIDWNVTIVWLYDVYCQLGLSKNNQHHQPSQVTHVAYKITDDFSVWTKYAVRFYVELVACIFRWVHGLPIEFLTTGLRVWHPQMWKCRYMWKGS